MAGGFVVTGTDTGVGKTVIAAALAGHLGARYWKPVQAGLEDGGDSARVAALSGLPPEAILPEAYRLTTPCSPHQAAEIDGVHIDADRLALPDVDGPLVVEGAGGVLVPLRGAHRPASAALPYGEGLGVGERGHKAARQRRREHTPTHPPPQGGGADLPGRRSEVGTLLYADVFARWGLSVVLVARTTLGTINHSLLSIEALRARKVPIAGVAFVGDENAESERVICAIGKVRRLGRLPFLDPLDAASLRKAFAANFNLSAPPLKERAEK